MKTHDFVKIFLTIFVSALLGVSSFACKKGEAPPTDQEEAQEAQATEQPEATTAAEPGKPEGEAVHKSEAPKEGEEEEGQKVDSVKGAFQYTGKEMEKGFKKAGHETKKFFVGEDEKKEEE